MGIDGVFGRDSFIADAGRAGGPMEPLLLTVLLLLVGDGAGEICDKVSIVRSDRDSLGLRFVDCSLLAIVIVAFSLSLSTTASSALAFGGVVSKLV